MKQRHPVAQAVRQLRIALGESQQQFAYRTKTAIRTIARYETTAPPGGKRLIDFETLAREKGLADLADIFRKARQNELEPTSRAPFPRKLSFRNEEELRLAAGLKVALAMPGDHEDVRKIKRLLTPFVEALDDLDDAGKALVSRLSAVRKRLASGESPEDIARDFGCKPESLILFQLGGSGFLFDEWKNDPEYQLFLYLLPRVTDATLAETFGIPELVVRIVQAFLQPLLKTEDPKKDLWQIPESKRRK